jgi:putative hemolysin
MKRTLILPTSLVTTGLILLLLLATGCRLVSDEETTVVDEAIAAAMEVPAPVTTAQESALEFLRTSANHCVPPEGVQWHVKDQQTTTPAGYGAYRFSAEGCNITVSYPLAVESTAYHVSLTNDVTGFCWQAVIDDHGQILRTGVAADTEDAAGNPAASFCHDQEHTYEIRTLANGQQCGACVFSDGSACKAWDYFHGDCAPGDNPPGS